MDKVALLGVMQSEKLSFDRSQLPEQGIDAPSVANSIGALVIIWSKLEEELGVWCSFVRRDPNILKLNKNIPLQTAQMLKLVEEASANLFSEQEGLVRKISVMLSLAAKYSAERNVLIHGSWLGSKPEQAYVFRTFDEYEISHKDRYAVNEPDVAALCHDILDLAQKFMELHYVAFTQQLTFSWIEPAEASVLQAFVQKNPRPPPNPSMPLRRHSTFRL